MKSFRFAVTAIAVCGCWLSGCAKPHPIVKTPTPVSAPVVAETPERAKPAAVAERIAPEPKPLPSRYPDAQTREKIETLLSRIQDAYFDYDKHFLRPDAMTVLSADAKTLSDILRQYPDFKLRVEGYCDERGSAEYNLALGDARAVKTKEFLTNLGLPGEQMNVVSLGKETQVCSEHTETCWQKNRRAHVATADSRIHQ